jgi:hypothetical protein
MWFCHNCQGPRRVVADHCTVCNSDFIEIIQQEEIIQDIRQPLMSLLRAVVENNRGRERNAFESEALQFIMSTLMEISGEDRPAGLTNEQVDALPTVKISENDEKECPICQDEYQVDQELIKLGCDHKFHPPCIRNWLNVNPTCPVCRFSLVD